MEGNFKSIVEQFMVKLKLNHQINAMYSNPSRNLREVIKYDTQQ